MKAFPDLPITSDGGVPFIDHDGADLRDIFAIGAMQGIMHAENWRDLGMVMENISIPENIAKHAYKMADAMIKERNKS